MYVCMYLCMHVCIDRSTPLFLDNETDWFQSQYRNSLISAFVFLSQHTHSKTDGLPTHGTKQNTTLRRSDTELGEHKGLLKNHLFWVAKTAAR